MEYLIALIVGYLLGSVNMAYILGKLKGFDIRTVGTKSAGASNAKITMGWPAFFIVLIYDAGKSLIAFYLIRYIYPDIYSAAVLAGCGAVNGHNYPFYMQFKGGKGFAAYIGLLIALNIKAAAIIIVIALVLAFLANWIVAATFTIIWATPLYLLFFTDTEIIAVIFVALTSLVIFSKHIINLKHLVKHQEIGINGCYVGTKEKAMNKVEEDVKKAKKN